MLFNLVRQRGKADGRTNKENCRGIHVASAYCKGCNRNVL